MNRVLELLREQLGRPPDASDRHLLDRFRDERDEVAFAELVRRYGPVVWGVCRRRLANTHDAEDAFQATFLVLVRRANRLSADLPLGPWLHRVAVMTTQRARESAASAVSGPMDHEVPALGLGPAIERLDLDAALLALPERYRAAVVLCHLQGLTRREAATQLGCREGTLSARLSRALARLRARLGVGFPAILAAAGTTAAPAVLSAATVRAAAIYTTSTLTAAGVSPVGAGLTDGVLRMFWMKKVLTGVTAVVLVAGGLLAGFATRSDGVARADEPLAGEPQAKLGDRTTPPSGSTSGWPICRSRRERSTQCWPARQRKGEAGEQRRRSRPPPPPRPNWQDIAIVVGEGKSAFTVREVVNGKVAEVTCSDLDILTTYLTRAFNDPRGPKNLRVSAYKDHPYDHLRQVLAACATAGYAKALFSVTELRYSVRTVPYTTVYRTVVTHREVEPTLKPGEIDLTKYTPMKP